MTLEDAMSAEKTVEAAQKWCVEKGYSVVFVYRVSFPCQPVVWDYDNTLPPDMAEGEKYYRVKPEGYREEHFETFS